MHRDLKPENFVFSDPTCKVLKLIDFGSATHYNCGTSFVKKIGTPYYVSPEVLQKNYNEKCDLWSLGIVMKFMMTNERPFDGETV